MSNIKQTSATAACHCKAISITVSHLPEYLNACQCSICRRYSAAWAYYKGSEVQIKVQNTLEYEELPKAAGTPATLSEKMEHVDLTVQRPSPLSSASLGDATGVYVWGDKEIEFHRCSCCGCVTHWWHTERLIPWDSRMGLNGRLFETEVLEALEIRKSAGPSRERGEAAPEV